MAQCVIEVVGGIIRRGEKYLLGKRPLGKSQGGHWEFIGGKIEPGESPEQALARECMEEIALPIVNAKIRTAVTHAYPDRTIHLTLIDCEAATGAEPTALEHSELGWFTPEEMKGLDFCAADAELVPVLFADGIKSEGIVLDKKIIKEAVKAAMQGACAGFDNVTDDLRSCHIGAYEDLEDSGWRGKWTERIRNIVREKTPGVECVCVKPLPVGKIVWYSVDIM